MAWQMGIISLDHTRLYILCGHIVVCACLTMSPIKIYTIHKRCTEHGSAHWCIIIFMIEKCRHTHAGTSSKHVDRRICYPTLFLSNDERKSNALCFGRIDKQQQQQITTTTTATTSGEAKANGISRHICVFERIK